MSETVRFAYGEIALAHEYVKDESNDEALLAAPGDVLRIPGGCGWRVWNDQSGAPCVTMFTAAECDAFARNAGEAAAVKLHEEERLRELSRMSRELGHSSLGDAR